MRAKSVSVPYWGSNYLIKMIEMNRWDGVVSVPYWGSNYLIKYNSYDDALLAFPSPTGVLII